MKLKNTTAMITLIVVIFIVVSLYAFRFAINSLKNEGYNRSIEILKASSTINKEIGVPFTESEMVFGKQYSRENSVDLSLIYWIKGEKSSARVTLHAKKREDKWFVKRLDVEVKKTGKIIFIVKNTENQ